MTEAKINMELKIAPLTNVRLFSELMSRMVDAPDHLPNWGVFSGESGRGKTSAAAHVALTTGAIYIECGSTWATQALVDAIAHELNMGPIKGSVSIKVRRIIELLVDDPRPMVIDEADHLVKKSMIDVIREITDKSKSPVVLIGEQNLPQKLMAFERAHNRVLEWVETAPCTLTDAKALHRLYCADVKMADDLLLKFVSDTQGSARRIVTNIDRARAYAKRIGRNDIDVKTYVADNEIYKGLPIRRSKQVAA